MKIIVLEILIIFVLIVANGLFAMSEIAIVSARKARLKQLSNEGNLKARTALQLATDPADFLSSVQIGITLVGILAGAYGGATLARQLQEALQTIPWLAGSAEVVSMGIVVMGITYLSLVLGELVPKRLALNQPERLASLVAPPMQILARLTRPFVRFLSLSTNAMLGLLRVRPSAEPPVTEEEIKILIDQGAELGMFDRTERDMLRNVFRLADRRASTIMTPRTDIVWLDINEQEEELHQKISSASHSRFPVCDGSLDNLLGFVRTKDVLATSLKEGKVNLRVSLLTPVFVPESATVFKVLEQMRNARKHIVFVVDEYGSITGIVSVNDVLESIVGDLPTIEIPLEQPIVQRSDGSWLVDAAIPIDEFKEYFRLSRLPGEESGHFQTLAGFVMMMLGKIPKPADHFAWAELRFEVVDMDGQRIDKVLVNRDTGRSARKSVTTPS